MMISQNEVRSLTFPPLRSGGDSMEPYRRAIWVLLPVLALFATVLVAQTIVSTLRGRVTDSQGAAISGATVTVTQKGTNLVRSTHTDGLGQYLIANLPAAAYDVSVEQ